MDRRRWKLLTLPFSPGEVLCSHEICCSPARPQHAICMPWHLHAWAWLLRLCMLCLAPEPSAAQSLCHSRRSWYVSPSLVQCIHISSSRLRDGGVPPYNLKRYTIHGKKASFAVHCPSAVWLQCNVLAVIQAKHSSPHCGAGPWPSGWLQHVRISLTGTKPCFYPLLNLPLHHASRSTGMHGALRLSSSASNACTGPAVGRWRHSAVLEHCPFTRSGTSWKEAVLPPPDNLSSVLSTQMLHATAQLNMCEYW